MLKCHGFGHINPDAKAPLPPEPTPMSLLSEAQSSGEYPIEQQIGQIPKDGNFDSFTWPQQIAISALRTANNQSAFNEQLLDYQVVASQNPGHLAGNVALNAEFLQRYVSNGAMNEEAYESWVSYNNWVLAINDGNSRSLWNGVYINFRGYKGWYIHEKSSDYNAVAYP